MKKRLVHNTVVVDAATVTGTVGQLVAVVLQSVMSECVGIVYRHLGSKYKCHTDSLQFRKVAEICIIATLYILGIFVAYWLHVCISDTINISLYSTISVLRTAR